MKSRGPVALRADRGADTIAAGLDVRATLFVAAVAAMLFCLLAWLLLEAGPTNAVDQQLEAAIRGWRDPGLDRLMLLATDLCTWQIVAAGLTAAILYFIMQGQRLAALALLVSVLGDSLIVSTLKPLFARLRPDQADALLPATGASFPSGHTFAAVAFYALLALLAAQHLRGRSARALVIGAGAVFCLLVGVSRVYLGAHWPSDVAGSWLLGTAWIALVSAALSITSRRFNQEHRPRRELRLVTVLLVLAWVCIVVVFSIAQPGLEQTLA